MNIESFLTGTLLGSVLIGLVIYFLRNYIRNVTKNYFDKNIENHKQDLTKELKGIEFNYQRRMEDFSLYTQKRHAVYAELYEKINKATSDMSFATSAGRMYPIQQVHTTDKDDFKESLQNEGFNEEDIKKTIAMWDKDIVEASCEAMLLFDKKRIMNAHKSRVDAINYFNVHELYLNEKLSKMINELFNITFELYKNEARRIRFPEGKRSFEIWDKLDENNDLLQIKREEIKKQMREELSIGDYTSK